MKRLLLPLITALVLPTAVNAEVSDEVHKRCKDVKDYLGCVKTHSRNKIWNFLKRSDEHEAKRLFKEGKKLHENEDYYDAIQKYSLAIDLDPKYIDAYVNRGILFELTMQQRRACSDWKKASKLGDQESAKWVKDECLGYIVHQGKKYVASQPCPDGKSMHWSVPSGLGRVFGVKVSEIGCMTAQEFETYEMNAKNRRKKSKQKLLDYGKRLGEEQELREIKEKSDYNFYKNLNEIGPDDIGPYPGL